MQETFKLAATKRTKITPNANRTPSYWSRWQRFAWLSCFSFTIEKEEILKIAWCSLKIHLCDSVTRSLQSRRYVFAFFRRQRQLRRRREALDTRYDEKRVKIAFSRLACLALHSRFALAWKTRKIAPDILQATPPKFNLNGGKGRNIAYCALFFSLKWHFESGKHSNVASLAAVSRGAMFSFPLDFLIYFSFYS